MTWGRNNIFEGNTANVNGPGIGFSIHNPEDSGNVVRCDNIVNDAGGGFSNLEGGCSG